MSHRGLLYGVSPFGNLRIKGCWAPPRSVSPPNRVLHRLLQSRHPPHALSQKNPYDLTVASRHRLSNSEEFDSLDMTRSSENRVTFFVSLILFFAQHTLSRILDSCIRLGKTKPRTEVSHTRLRACELLILFSCRSSVVKGQRYGVKKSRLRSGHASTNKVRLRAPLNQANSEHHTYAEYTGSGT